MNIANTLNPTHVLAPASLPRFPALYRWMRRLRAPATAAILIAGTVSLNYLAAQFPARWDLTPNGSHTLSAATVEFLQGLREPMEVTAFYPGLPPEALSDLLRQFERHAASPFTWEVLDPVQNIARAAHFGNKVEADARRVYVVSGEKKEEIDASEAPLTEERLVTAMVRMTSEARKVYFLQGEREYDIESDAPDGYLDLAGALERQNYTVAPLMLTGATPVPRDCQVLVLGGPRMALGEEAAASIRDYLDRGGSALFLIESALRGPAGTVPEGAVHPTLNEIMGEWGIHSGDDVVVDMANHLGQDIGCPATNRYPEHKKIVNGLGITFFLRPRSIGFHQPSGRRRVLAARLVETAGEGTSWAETDKNLFVQFTPGADRPGPVTLAGLVMQHPDTWEEGRTPTKIVAIGDADFVTNQYSGRHSNLALVLNSVAWLAQRENLPAGVATQEEAPRLDLTRADQELAARAMAAPPLMLGVVGLLVWRRRRRHLPGRHD